MSGYEYSPKELELRAECERGFGVGGRGGKAVSPTGELYVELINPNMLHAANGQAVFDLAVETFRKYAEGRSGTLYWRVWPEIKNTPSGWEFYMRVLVSDKPALIPSESDDRTANNAVRHDAYRVLTEAEKEQMVALKDLGAAFIAKCQAIGKSRELSLAITKAEEAVMWAVKSITK